MYALSLLLSTLIIKSTKKLLLFSKTPSSTTTTTTVVARDESYAEITSFFCALLCVSIEIEDATLERESFEISRSGGIFVLLLKEEVLL